VPLQRFRTLDEARAALFCRRGSREHLERMAALWERAWLLAPRSYPRGVQRFSTIEDANRESEERLLRFMRELRARRHAVTAAPQS
jgi:hypothetical protein